MANYAVWTLLGTRDGEVPPVSPTTHLAANVQEMFAVLQQVEPGLDVMEVCGGQGLVTKIAVRRRARAGRNFDIVTGTDLNEPAEIRALWAHIREHKPFLIILTPPCSAHGRWAQLNRVINYETWPKRLMLKI